MVEGCSGPTAESPKGKIPHHIPIRYLRNFSEEIFLLWSMAVVDLLPRAQKEKIPLKTSNIVRGVPFGVGSPRLVQSQRIYLHIIGEYL